MSEHTNAGGPDTPPDAMVDAGAGLSRTRSRAIAAGSGILAVVLLAGLVLSVRDDGSAPALAKLPLTSNGAGGERKLAAADAALAVALRFELAGTLPDLGTIAPVARFRLPALDAASVRDLALDLGVDEPATVSHDSEGWVVSGVQHELRAYPSGRAWSINVSPRLADAAGSTGASEPSRAVEDMGGGSSAPDVLPLPVEPTPVEPSVPPPPVNLPSAADAQRIARDQVTAAGMIDASWTAEVVDGGRLVAIACAPAEPCPDPAPGATTTRIVTFTKVVDDQPVAGLSWSVEVGDAGSVSGIYGTFTELEPLGAYPLRTPQAAFAALTENPYGGAPMPTGAAESGRAVDLGPDTPVSDTPASDTLVSDAPIDADADPGAMVVAITGAERAAMLVSGVVDGTDVMFVVPAYRFVGHYADGSDFETTVSALDPSVIAAPQ